MPYQLVFLHQAKADLDYLKKYLLKNFSKKSWQDSFEKIKKSVNSLKIFPLRGSIPPELENLHLSQYRQIISGANRIIYEVRHDTVYIHIICDSRQNMKDLLVRRLLRIV